MNADIVEGKWNEVKGKLKQQWGKLTDNQITQINGSYDELCGSLQKAYGYEKNAAEKEISQFIKQNGWLDK